MVIGASAPMRWIGKPFVGRHDHMPPKLALPSVIARSAATHPKGTCSASIHGVGSDPSTGQRQCCKAHLFVIASQFSNWRGNPFSPTEEGCFASRRDLLLSTVTKVGKSTGRNRRFLHFLHAIHCVNLRLVTTRSRGISQFVSASNAFCASAAAADFFNDRNKCVLSRGNRLPRRALPSSQ